MTRPNLPAPNTALLAMWTWAHRGLRAEDIRDCTVAVLDGRCARVLEVADALGA